jgi:hypothetical protein
MKSQLGTLTIVFLLATGTLWSSINGSISGTVTDSSGAVIPQVSVVARNTETGIQTSTQTNMAGFYSLPALPAGPYEVIITKKGFEEYRQTGLVLDVNTALRVDATLKVGAVTQEVSVSATAAHVETSSTQMGDVIGSAKMLTLPLNGRSYLDLIGLQPGVAPGGSGEGASVSISGQRETSNGFMINGGNAEDKQTNGPAITPNLDSLAEFRVLTNNADAEYGNYNGGLINVLTKSGTNAYHGDAFDFVRNPDFDARNFYSPTRGVLHQNQFGGTMGGPIRKDKLFFFTDYQGTRQVQGVDTGLILLPSMADRGGNLSDQAAELINANASVNGGYWANVLSQELGYTVTAGEPYFTYTPPTPSGSPPAQTVLCTSAAQGCVFPNAIIPKSAFTAPSQFLMQYIPPPNFGTNEFTTSAYDYILRDDMGSGRFDANTRLGMVAGYYYMEDWGDVNPYGAAMVPGFSTRDNGRDQMINLGITKSFGPSSVNELRLIFMRNVYFYGLPNGGAAVSLASQGFTGIVPMAPQLETVEPVGFNSFTIGGPAWPSRFFENTYQVVENFSKIIGTHTIKFGGSTSYDQVTRKIDGNSNGGFSFDGAETGSDFADFLIGAPVGFSQGEELPLYERSRYYALYAQDSWRATSSLTLNGGLRWEVSSPWWEAHNEVYQLIPGEQSVVFPGAPLGYVFPGDPGVPRTLSPTRYNNFGPRVGFAYSPHAASGFLGKVLGGPGKTSVRAGYGVFFTAFEGEIFSQELAGAPFGYWWSNPGPPMFANPYIDRPSGQDWGQRFPAPVPPLNVGPKNPDNAINWAQLEPITSSPAFFHDNRLPYSEHYNFSLQRQLGGATLLSLSYVGTQGHRLLGTVESNPGNPALCLSVSQASETTDGVVCGPYGENGVYHPISGGVITTTRYPYSAAFGSNGYDVTAANSNYNALEVTLRRTVGRLEFLAGYTWSKSLDNASGSGLGQGDTINPINYKVTKALSAFHSPNNFVVSYTYQIPFEKLWHPGRLASGWSISGITRFADGFPVYITESDDNSLLGTFGNGNGGMVDEPNRLPGRLKIIDPRKQNLITLQNPYFNINLFTKEALGQLGNSNRRFFVGPGTNNWDICLAKELALTETKKLQFRGELFSAFNHAQFAGPTGEIINPTFGFVTGAGGQRIGQVAMKFIF